LNEFGKEWEEDVSEATMHLWCYRNHNQYDANLLPKHEHFIKAIKAIWPEKFSNGEDGYVWSEWAERRAWSWCYNEFQCWWGPAASAKSTDGAVFSLTDWFGAPDKTSVTLCSTSLEGLRQRIWREIVRYHSMAKMLDPSLFGSFRKQPPMLSYEPEDTDSAASTINAIFGIAMPEGTDENAMRNAFGKHNRYNILILDEMQMMHPAAMNAYDNVSAGGIENKFLGMGNPWSRLDGLGKASEPSDGWNSITPELEQWNTKKGVCLYFDGLKSPGIAEPDKYHFLMRQKDIDNMMEDPGPDSPRFWSQRRGWCPPEGLTETVMSENLIEKFKMKLKAIWRDRPRMCAGLDPAFSSGGDKAIYTTAKVGLGTNGMMVVELQSPERINLQLTKDGEPLTYVLAGAVIEKLIRDGLTPADLTLDTTGAQMALADIIDVEWKSRMRGNHKLSAGRCRRLSFGGKASDLPFSMTNPEICSNMYANKVAELWMLLREFGINDQIRGLSDDAVLEFCTRLVLGAIKGKKLSIEPKSEMKNRTGGRSPDTADSAVCVIDHVRYTMGVHPGSKSSGSVDTDTQRMANEMDIDAIDDVYPEEESLSDPLDF